MSPPPVPGRPPPSSDSPFSGGPILQFSDSSKTGSLVNRSVEVPGNPHSPALTIAPTSGHRLGSSVVLLDSSSLDDATLQISRPSDPVCSSDLALQRSPVLFTAQAVASSQIPAISHHVCSIQAPICDPLVQTKLLTQESYPPELCNFGNFRSTNDGTIHSSSSLSFANSSSVVAPLSNSFGRIVPQVMGNQMVSPIPGNLRPSGYAQIGGFRPSLVTKASKLGTEMAGSSPGFTGSGLLAPSPISGGGQLGGHRVDSAESTPSPRRVDSAVHASPVVVAPGSVAAAPVGSYSSLLASAHKPRTNSFEGCADVTTHYFDQKNLDGIPGIAFHDAFISAVALPFQFSLVGRITENRGITPNTSILAAISQSTFVGMARVRFLPRGFLVLILSREEDFVRYSLIGTLSVGSVSIWFSKWTPDFKFVEESPITPVWVRIPNLPLHLYPRRALFAIAKILGNPLEMDEFTTDRSRASFVRMCIEIDVSKPLLDKIWVSWGSHVLHLDVVYERVPFYCSECKMLGHSSQRCVSTGYPSASARAKAQGKRPQASTSVAPDRLGPSQDVPSGSASMPPDPGWHRQRRRRRPVRRIVPTSTTHSGNPFEVLQVPDAPAQCASSGVGLSRDPGAIVEDIPYETEFPGVSVSPGISGVDPSAIVVRLDTSVVSGVVSDSRPGSSDEVSLIQVDDVPVVSVVEPPVFLPPSLFELGSGSGGSLPDSVPPPTTSCLSLPLPGRTRSQRRRFYRAQAAQLGSPYGRPPDPG